MYSLSYFKEEDKNVVLEFVRAHPFALICGCGEDGKPVATQVPLFIDEREDKLFLSGHIMKNTDHHKAFLHNPNLLAIFSGAHTYISASWYDNKQQASTWNYMSVHAEGQVRFLDEQALLNVLKRTTAHFENDPQSPAGFDHLPVEYVQHLSKAIVAFEVEVLAMDNVFKLSQNRDEESYHAIIKELYKRNDPASEQIAVEMEKRIPHMNIKWHNQ